jgi:hypothetical protein
MFAKIFGENIFKIITSVTLHLTFFDCRVLHPGNKKSNTNRTTVKWSTLNPDFHEQGPILRNSTSAENISKKNHPKTADIKLS